MSKINGGATIWARQTLESEIFYWKPDKWFKIWFYIVNKVNHKDNRLFDRGENLFTYREIEVATKAKRGQVDSFIRWAKHTTMLTTRKTTRGMVVKVLNYAKYQELENYKNDTTHDKPDDLHTKHTRNTNDTINNNGNNEKNEKNVNTTTGGYKKNTETEEITQAFLQGWNRVHGTKYSAWKPLVKNLTYWLEQYKPDDILQAMVKVKQDKYWKNKMTPMIMLRQKNSNGEEVDYIGQLINKKTKEVIIV